MNIPKAIVQSRIAKTILLLIATWVLFNCIFFLGTNPSQWIDTLFQWLMRIVWNNVGTTTARDFLIFGFLTGVGGFLVYVPNIMLLFLFSHILHDTGISPRVARFVSPIFRFFGLNGESFQPMLFGFGCSVTAIHGAHYIQSPKNRLVTMLIAPFMSCGSKFGVYVLLISFVFTPRLAGTVMFALYLLGVFVAFISSFAFRAILRIGKETVFDEPEPTLLKKPDVLRIIKQTMIDGWEFCKKAGSVIVVAATIIWALSYWPGISQDKYKELEAYAQQTNQPIPSRYTLSYHSSYAARIGQFLEPAFKPLGQNWKNSIALVTSIAGRSTIISTLLTLYGIDYAPGSKDILTHALSADPDFSKLAGFAMMIFVLLCGSCLASIMMFYHETKSYLYTALFILYPIIVAWTASSLFYTLGRVWIR